MDFYHFLNYGLFKDGGDCYGFSSTSILYFRHYELGDQSYPYYPALAGSVSSLPGQTGKYCFRQYCLTTSDTLSQTTFPIYIHQTYGMPYEIENAPNQPDEQTSVQLLTASIKSGVPVIMALGPVDGHAVVAWGYTQYPDGSLTIGVSDPNYGNAPRYAHYSNGRFSYSGTYNWTTFSVVSPGMFDWRWLSLEGIGAAQWSSTVNYTDSHYSYVFSSVPITVLSPSGQASFSMAGDSLTFSTTINGAVGFEEGTIQVYGIPIGIPFTIKDPGEMSSMITVVIPRNQTSIVGYQLSTTSQKPLNLTIAPSSDRLNITSTSDVQNAVVFFSVGEHSHSVLNATAVPVASSQTEVFSVSSWDKLNSTKSAPTVQIYEPGKSKPVENFTLTGVQQGTNQPPSYLMAMILVAIMAVLVAIGAVLLVSRRRTQARKAVL